MADEKNKMQSMAMETAASCDRLPEAMDIQPMIRTIRGQQVIMFQLTKEEFEDGKSQFATSKSVVMGARKLPYAFTENGVAMLSSVLR